MKKPEGTDVVNIDDLNQNFDILDVEVTKLATASQAGRMSAADKVKLDGIESGAQRNAVTSVNNKTGAVTLTASDVGASPTGHTHAFTEITSKPTTLAGYGITDAIPASQKGAVNGVASLDGSAKVPTSQLPSASTTQAGIVQLNDTLTSTSTTQAATANAVKQVNDAVVAHSAENATGAHKAKNIAVEDVNNRFTATDVEGVLNELFTFANDGKTSIASVIGSPATSGDTFATLANHIQNAKNTMATNLTNKGTSANGTETLQSLANKIANVVTGKYNVGDVLATNAVEGPVYKKVLYNGDVKGWTIDDSQNIYFWVNNTTVIKMNTSGTILWQVNLSSYFSNIQCIAVVKSGSYVFVGGAETGNTDYGRIIALNASNGSVVNGLVDRSYNHVGFIYVSDNGGAIVYGWTQPYTYQYSPNVIIADLSGTTLGTKYGFGANYFPNNNRAIVFTSDSTVLYIATGVQVYRFYKSGGSWNYGVGINVGYTSNSLFNPGSQTCFVFNNTLNGSGDLPGYSVDFSTSRLFNITAYLSSTTYANQYVHYFRYGTYQFSLQDYIVLNTGGTYHVHKGSGTYYHRQQGNSNWNLVPLVVYNQSSTWEFRFHGQGYKILS
ncbi:tail fiber protein [Geobacillus sp. LEMMY01]|uniref:tail fiber protein n=1 Tax=Geobacillus sp. LEMMY01 TaxID=1954237 RepID=UPI0020CA6C0D|nr:tail fiber protein [Geobacillus sp. LEMMY01]